MSEELTFEGFVDIVSTLQEGLDGTFDWDAQATSVKKFAATLGLGPDYTPKPRKTESCPACGSKNAYHKEVHPDTSMNEIVLYCPDCKEETSETVTQIYTHEELVEVFGQLKPELEVDRIGYRRLLLNFEKLGESAAVTALANKIRKTDDYKMGIGRATALYMARGDYDGSQAYKMALHLVSQQAKKFYGPKYFDTYTPEVRLQVQKKLAAYARADKDKHNGLLPKKYQKGFKGYTEARRSTAAFTTRTGDELMWLYNPTADVCLSQKGGDHSTLIQKMIADHGETADMEMCIRGWYTKKSKELCYYPPENRHAANRTDRYLKAVEKVLKIKPVKYRVLESVDTMSITDVIEAVKYGQDDERVAEALTVYARDFAQVVTDIIETLKETTDSRRTADVALKAAKLNTRLKFMREAAINKQYTAVEISAQELEDLFVECETFIAEAEADAKGEEPGTVNFKQQPIRLGKKKPQDKGYVDKKKQMPPEEPEPDSETGEPEPEPEYPFKLGQVQAYYDLQVAQGLDQVQGVKRVRQKFGIKNLVVNPAGEIQPVDGLKKTPPPPPPELPPEGDEEGGEEEEELDKGLDKDGSEPEPDKGQKTGQEPKEPKECIEEGYEKCPVDFKTLKKNKVKLTDEERQQVLKAKAVWHWSSHPKPVSAVFKSVVGETTYYVTATHRAFNATKSLKGTIARFHDFIKGTA